MIAVRIAAPQDIPELLNIYNYAVRHSTATFDLEEQTLEQRSEWFKRYTGAFPLIVATEGQKVIGYGCLSPFRAKPAYDRTVENSIYVDPMHWGKGAGSLLLQELIARARELRHHAVIACITSGNDTSVRLHERFGFALCGQLKEVGYKFEAWQDVYFYELIL